MRAGILGLGLGLRLGLGLGLAIAVTLPVAAEPVDMKTAKSQLFGTRGVSVNIIQDADFLSDEDRKILNTVGAQQKYYSAIAISPDEGVLSNPTVAAANFHDMATARTAALKECNARKKSGAAACRVVAEITPKKWTARSLQLNYDATEGFRKEYRRAQTPKALAISIRTGQWSAAAGPGSDALATEACNAKIESGAKDCAVVIADE